MRAVRALAVAALVLGGVGCGDDSDDDADVDAGQEVEVDDGDVDDGDVDEGPDEAPAEDDAAPDDGDAGRPSLDDLTESQAAYAQDVCERARSWVEGTATPGPEELTITGNALSSGEGGPLLGQLGSDLTQIQDPAAGTMVYENLVIVCTAYQQGS